MNADWKCFFCGQGKHWRKRNGYWKYPALEIPAGEHQRPHPKRICSACVGLFRKMLEEYVNAQNTKCMAGTAVPCGVQRLPGLASDHTEAILGKGTNIYLRAPSQGYSFTRGVPEIPILQEDELAARNLKLERAGDILTITVDLSRRLKVTRGNNIAVASTGTWLDIYGEDGQPDPRGMRINLNVVRDMSVEERRQYEAGEEINFEEES